jgi:hypothetical protein
MAGFLLDKQKLLLASQWSTQRETASISADGIRIASGLVKLRRMASPRR